MSKAKAVELKQKLIKLPKNYPQNDNRVLIREGILFIEEDKKLKPRWCFLFNDLFLETKPLCDFADVNTRLADPNTQFKYKNYIVLNACHIDENPSTLKKTVKQQHATTPFILIGSNLEKASSISSSDKKRILYKLIYSTGKGLIKERELWCTDIHLAICNIYNSINNDMMNYGWQNQYRKGNIFHAVYTLHNDLVSKLINDNNIILNEHLMDINGHNLLHLASAVDNVDFIEEYGSKFNIDTVDCNGWSALRIGCDNDNLESIKVITEELYPNLDEYYPQDKTLNPTSSDAIAELDDRTILHELSMRGQSHLMRVLLDTSQINLEALDKNGNTPLHISAKKNQESCLLLLLQYGAPPNLADFKGNRALHITNKEELARWLVAYGARLDLANQFKKTCRDIWGNKLDKYLELFAKLNATDCRIQTNIAPNTAWFDDKLSNACLGCGNSFTIWSRRHHCRCCGLLVCQLCSNRKLQFTNNGKPSLERSCDKCFNKNHTKYTRNKTYNFRGKSYNMVPNEYYKMVIMETQYKGSYINYIKQQQEQKNDIVLIDNNDNDDIDSDLKQNDNDNNVITPSSTATASANGSGSDNKKKNGKKKHNISYSVSAMFGKNKKKDNKNVSKHQVAQSQAIENVNKALSKAHERGEKLNELADKSNRLSDNAKNFNDMAKQLANKKW